MKTGDGQVARHFPHIPQIAHIVTLNVQAGGSRDKINDISIFLDKTDDSWSTAVVRVQIAGTPP